MSQKIHCSLGLSWLLGKPVSSLFSRINVVTFIRRYNYMVNVMYFVNINFDP